MTAEQLRNSILQEAISGRLVPPACRQAGKTLTMNPTPHLQGKKVWFTYVIECEDGTFYKGFTDDLVKRYKQHCDGIGAEHTKIHKPKQLYYWEMHYSQNEAIAREKYLKSGSGREWFLREVVNKPENWEPASALLDKIRDEKARLIKEGRLKKEKPFAPITDDEKFLKLPTGWAWGRLGELGMYRKGPFGSSLTKSMFVPKSSESFKVYEQKNAIQKDYRLGEYYISKAKYEAMQSFIVEVGDIIVSCAGTIGETYVIPEGAPEGIINQALMRVKLYDASLLKYWLLYFDYIVMTNTELKGNGSAIKNIPPFEILKNMTVPIPPLAEQKRIVAKLEELLPIVEQYGKAQKELDELNAALPARLRQSVLQQAIEGKLTEHDLHDHWAIDYVSHLPQLKYKSSPEWPQEIPFEIPENWRWCRIGDICELMNGYAFKSNQYKDKGVRVIRITNVQDGYIVDNSPKFYPSIPDIEKYILKEGDLLMSLTGNVGRVGMLQNEMLPAALNQRVACLRLKDERIKPFLFWYLRCAIYRERCEESGHGMAQLNISTEWIKQEYFPLPPLAEQKRIVAKIEELFAEIDKLTK